MCCADSCGRASAAPLGGRILPYFRPARQGRWAARWAILGLSLALLWPALVQAAPGAGRLAGFPSVRQWYPLDCEYAAAAAVTLYWGRLVSQRTFLREVPSDPNPHHGFRGAVNGPFGGIGDYGVYAEALVPVLTRHGYQAIPFYHDLARLQAELRAGHPLVVWVTAGVPDPPIYIHTYQGASFRLVPGEHAVVVYGEDATGVDIMDVGTGGYYHSAWTAFLRRWGYFDEMALQITPV